MDNLGEKEFILPEDPLAKEATSLVDLVARETTSLADLEEKVVFLVL